MPHVYVNKHEQIVVNVRPQKFVENMSNNNTAPGMSYAEVLQRFGHVQTICNVEGKMYMVEVGTERD